MNTTFDLPHDIGRVPVSLIVEGADPAVPGTRKRKLTCYIPIRLPPDLKLKIKSGMMYIIANLMQMNI